MGIYKIPKTKLDETFEIILRVIFGAFAALFVFFLQIGYMVRYSLLSFVEQYSHVTDVSFFRHAISSPSYLFLPLLMGIISAFIPGKVLSYVGREAL